MKLVFRLFKAGALFSFMTMIVVVGIQVFARYFLDTAPPWTEEVARIMFIYTVAFGTAAGIVNGDFIRLDLIARYLPAGILNWLDVITDVIIIIFAALLFMGSIHFVKLGMDEISPALEITMGYIFMSMGITALAVFIFTLKHLWQIIKNKR